MLFLRLIQLALLLMPISSALADEQSVMSQLKVGQLWEYKHHYPDAQPLVYVGRIEEMEPLGTIVHVTIVDVPIVHPTTGQPVQIVIGHMPFMADAIEGSLTRLVGTGDRSKDIEDGYAVWKEAEGGAFSLSVHEAVMATVGDYQ